MEVRHSEKPLDIRNLLYRLNSKNAGAAWAEFMDHFASLIMKVSGQFEYEQNRTNECFLYVCEKLSDAGFRRLSRFNTRGKAGFKTWLSTVVFNLCVDWHRKEFGRVQMLPAVSALPDFDQAVYRLIFCHGISSECCFQTLFADFPDLTREQLAEAIGRVHSILTPRQRWQLSVQLRRHKRQGFNEAQADINRLENPGALPETITQDKQQTESLQRAMSHLSADQRLLVNLRFHQGLTLSRVSKIMRLGDPFRARRQIQAALDTLATHMNASNSRTPRKN